MISNTFIRCTKWNVLKKLIFKEIDDLIILDDIEIPECYVFGQSLIHI